MSRQSSHTMPELQRGSARPRCRHCPSAPFASWTQPRQALGVGSDSCPRQRPRKYRFRPNQVCMVAADHHFAPRAVGVVPDSRRVGEQTQRAAADGPSPGWMLGNDGARQANSCASMMVSVSSSVSNDVRRRSVIRCGRAGRGCGPWYGVIVVAAAIRRCGRRDFRGGSCLFA